MIPYEAVLRVARPTDNLAAITGMYCAGLGFELLGGFEDHQGFYGALVGHKQHPYHLEFTHHKGTVVGKSPTQDNLLVFYIADKAVWQQQCHAMLSAGFTAVVSYNPYWDQNGKTFEDVDGYRVVLALRDWQI